MNKDKQVKPEDKAIELTDKGGLNHVKYIGVILINVMLAAVSVYLLRFWVIRVSSLDWFILIMNFLIVILLPITYFIGQTYYNKGTGNSAKKAGLLILLSVIIIGLMLLSVKVPSDMVYPLSGAVIVTIAYYMLSLSAATLGSMGLIITGIVSTASISFGLWFKTIGWGAAGYLSLLAVFVILFLGGVAPHIRAYAHGIRGVNKDGGGFGGNTGDRNDGDDDTDDE